MSGSSESLPWFVPKTRRLRSIYGIWIAVFQIGLWWSFLAIRPESRHALAVSSPVPLLVNILTLIPLVYYCGLSKKAPLWLQILAVVYTFSMIVNFFSARYWAIGTSRNFSHPLTHLDSIYFTLGVLTTAGTSPLSATSQSAIGWVTAQFLVDLAFLTGGVALVLANVRRRHDSSP